MNDLAKNNIAKTATDCELAFLNEKLRIQVLDNAALRNKLENTKKTEKGSTLSCKLEKIIDQISFFQKKEQEIIYEIDMVEQKHRFMRENQMLRTSGNKSKDPVNKLEENEEFDDEKKPMSTIGALMWIWVLAKLFKNNEKQARKSNG